MLTAGSIVLPSDLTPTILASTHKTGWFGGSAIVSESVFVVTYASIGEEKVVSNKRHLLLSHRAFEIGKGEQGAELVQWVRVGKDFSAVLSDWRTFATTYVEEALEIQLDGRQFICLLQERDEGPLVRAICAKSSSGETRILPVHLSFVSEPRPYARLPEETLEVLGRSNVAIVGIGSGGSEIALDLSCSGVGKLQLFDGEHLEEENYIRHVLDRQDLGRYKVSGLTTAIENKTLPTQVAADERDVIIWASEFREQLRDSRPDLLICATDTRRSRGFLNHCAIHMGIPLIIAGLLEGGPVGEVLLVIPKKTACYECVRLELGATLEKPASDDRPETPYAEGELDRLQSAVHRYDVAFIASLVTRVALQVLDSGNYEPLPTNYLVWGREKREGTPPFCFQLPLSVNYVPIAKRSDCPVCGRLAPELDGLDIDDRYLEIIGEIDQV
jgi:molybdopterin/thiamine biosynthesis adenylyltransferase